MNEREEAFEVAKLAAMVGGQMNLVDRMTTERMSTPANKINIHDFINKVKKFLVTNNVFRMIDFPFESLYNSFFRTDNFQFSV